jgi:hypothetical protein
VRSLSRSLNRALLGHNSRAILDPPVTTPSSIRAGCWRALAILLVCLVGFACCGQALAATCAPAKTGGSAPTDWPSFCWFDFSTYSDTLARSAGGQSFSFTLNDGSILRFNLTVSSTAATALNAVAAPAWTGAAVGNTAFLGIPGSPILCTATNASTVNVTFSGITLTPPAGNGRSDLQFRGGGR